MKMPIVDDKYQCPKCIGLPECACTLPRTKDTGKGNTSYFFEQKDVSQLIRQSVGCRLAKGFALLGGRTTV